MGHMDMKKMIDTNDSSQLKAPIKIEGCYSCRVFPALLKKPLLPVSQTPEKQIRMGSVA